MHPGVPAELGGQPTAVPAPPIRSLRQSTGFRFLETRTFQRTVMGMGQGRLNAARKSHATPALPQ
jgi:hypothetical protein